MASLLSRYGKTKIRYLCGGVACVDDPFNRVEYYIQIPITKLQSTIDQIRYGTGFWCKEGDVGENYLLVASKSEARVLEVLCFVVRIFRSVKKTLGGGNECICSYGR